MVAVTARGAQLTRIVVPKLRFQGKAYRELLLPFMSESIPEGRSEFLVEGPTGTGKSVLIGGLCKYAMRKYPGCNLVVLRAIRADLPGSFMQMWEEEVLDPDNDAWDRYMLYGMSNRAMSHKSRDVYVYPNGSKLWCMGMNEPRRFKSKAYDIVWPMELTEYTEEQLEIMHTRIRHRVDAPFAHRCLIGDANPEYPQHWANRRAIDINPETGKPFAHRIKTTLRDNPGYYDRDRQEYTEAGLDYLNRLKSQIRDPARRARYINGVWAAASGQILHFEESRHMFEGKLKPMPGKGWRIEFPQTHEALGDYVDIVGFAASYDWGKVHAGTLQIWGLDKEGRQYLVEEVYHSGKELHWWAERAVTLTKKYGLGVIVCDNAAHSSIQHFNKRLREEGGPLAGIAIPCKKRQGNRQESNMEILTDLFSEQPDGKPAVFIAKDARKHAPDPDLKQHGLADEIPGYVFAEFEETRHSGRAEDRPDRKCVDDGLDACVYMRVHVLGGRGIASKIPTAKETRDIHEMMRESYWSGAA